MCILIYFERSSPRHLLSFGPLLPAGRQEPLRVVLGLGLWNDLAGATVGVFVGVIHSWGLLPKNGGSPHFVDGVWQRENPTKKWMMTWG